MTQSLHYSALNGKLQAPAADQALIRSVLYVFFICLLLIVVPWDPDFFWHLTTGQYIWQHQSLPHGDIFSWSMPGHPWVLHEWLSEVLLYLCWSLAGEMGIRLLVAVTLTLALWLALRTALRIWPQPVRLLALTPAFALPLVFAASPRPHIFTHLFLAFFIHQLFSYKYGGKRRALWALPLAMTVWVNMHGGFMLGLALLLAMTLIAFGQARKDPANKQYRALGMCFFGCLAAALLNPDGAARLAYPFSVLSAAATPHIQEWQPVSLNTEAGLVFALVVATWLIALAGRRLRPAAEDLLLPLCAIAAGMAAIRNTGLAALILLPCTARLCRNGLRWLPPDTDQPLRGIPGPWSILLCAGLTLAAVAVYPGVYHRRMEVFEQQYPVGAVSVLAHATKPENLFNPYVYGGYLIYRLYPRQGVMIDGRADMYGDAFTLRHFAVEQHAIGWRAYFDQYRITEALVIDQTPLSRALAQTDIYRCIYDDGGFSLYKRVSP